MTSPVEDTSEYAGCVYYLHAGDFVPRYIGKTTKPLRVRFNQHLYEANRGSNLPSHRWMRKYGVENIQVCALALFTAEDLHMIDDAERYFIAQHRDQEAKSLLNLTDGGDGQSLGWVPSAETRARMSASRQNISAETRAKIGDANRGKTRSAEARANMSAAKQNMSEETRAKIGAASKDRKQSAEQRAKLSAAMQGRPKSAETRARMSKPKSTETCARMSAAKKGRPSMGTHTRWHTNRNIIKQECTFCTTNNKENNNE